MGTFLTIVICVCLLIFATSLIRDLRKTSGGYSYSSGSHSAKNDKLDLKKIRPLIEALMIESRGVINSDDLLKMWGVQDCVEKTFPKRHLDEILAGLRRMGYDLVPNYNYGHKRLAFNEMCVIYRRPTQPGAHKLNAEQIHKIELFLKLFSMVIFDSKAIQADHDYSMECTASLGAPKEGNDFFRAYLLWMLQKKQVFEKKVKDEVIALQASEKETFVNMLIKATYVNGNIDDKRVDALKKILPTLGVNPGTIHSLLHQSLTDEPGFAVVEKSEGAAEYAIRQPGAVRNESKATYHLDHNRLEELKQQSRKAQELLSDIFVQEEETEPETSSQPKDGMLELLERLFEKECWEKSEVQEICGRGVMLGNILEQINDYAYSKVEDIVVEEDGDQIYVTVEYKEHLI